MLQPILKNNAIYIRLYYISFNMLYNNIYQYAINGAMCSIKYVQIYHHI